MKRGLVEKEQREKVVSSEEYAVEYAQETGYMDNFREVMEVDRQFRDLESTLNNAFHQLKVVEEKLAVSRQQ
ncbi:hypothetical protein JYU14_02770 [Simkania negevensis]|uniref:Uncharacterized protein n=1 Tax=Simkania negevensis TaxID=83561 RepID=A0ABS3AQH9_9BACT|nr:hypothetical protein [Simkania negevensis]